MGALRNMLGGTLLAVAAAATWAAPQVDVLATGLVNPRGIAFAPDGTLYVAEAGKGGPGKCFVGGEGQSVCYGASGAIARIEPNGKGNVARVVHGLPSLAPAGGFGATGPQGISFAAAGGAKLTIGLGANPEEREGLGPRSPLFGRVLQKLQFDYLQAPVQRMPMTGKSGSPSQETFATTDEKSHADIAAFEAADNPDAGALDTNPFGILALGSHDVVADAGGNALLRVDADGAVSTLAVFAAREVPAPPFLGLPPGATIPMQAVPTSVAQGPDGWLYVGQLTGFPFPVGEANVYRVPAEGGTPQVFASGFTNIIGVAFDAQGRLYVLQIGNGLAAPGGPPLQPPGKLIRVNADLSHTVIHDQFYYPGGLAIGPDGAAYVTNFGIVPGRVPQAFPDGGQVLRIPLD